MGTPAVSSKAGRLEFHESHRKNIPLKRGFKLASLNVNKLSTHIDEVRILLADECLDVLAIQETKLDVSDNDSHSYICGY